MSQSIGDIFLNLSVNKAPFQKEVGSLGNTVTKTLKPVIGKIGVALGAAVGVASLVKFGKEATKLGSDLQEVQNVVDSTFPSMSKKVDEFASTAIERIGLSEVVTKEYMGIMGAMSKSFGFAEKEAYNMAESVTSLAADVASFYNLEPDVAYTKMKSIWTGETESLKELGVVMTQSALDQFALANGYKKTTAQMSEQEKVALRYKFVLDKLKGASGDFMRTQDGWANQTRILKLRFDQLKATIGQGLINVLTPVVKVLNTIVARLQDAATAFKNFTNSFMGIKGDTKGLVKTPQEISDAVSEVGDSVEKAGKKIKGSISNFDQLNLITSSTAESMKDAADIDLTSGLDSVLNDSSEVAENSPLVTIFEKIKEKLEPTIKAFDNLKKALEPVSKFVFDNIKSFYEDTLVPIGGWVLGEGLPRLLNVGTGLLNSINWDKLSEALKNLYSALAPFVIGVGKGLINFIEVMAEILKPVIATTSDLLAKAINAIAKAIKSIPEDVAIAIGGAIGGIAASILLFKGATAVAGVVKGIGSALGGFLTTISAHPLLAIAAGLSAITGSIFALEKYRFNESDIGKLVQALKDYNNEVKTMMDGHDKKIKNIDDEHSAVKTVADKYFELADSTVELTDEQKTMLITYANQLADMTPEIEGLIDRQTGAYKGTREEIELAIDKSFEYMRVQAMQEYLIDLYKEQAEGKRKIAEAEEKLIAEEEKNARLREQYNVDSNGYISSLGQTIRIITDDEKKLRKELEKTRETYGKVDKQILQVEKDITSYGASIKDSMKKAKKEVDDALSSIERKVKTFKLPTMEVKIGMNTSALEAFRKGTQAAGINAVSVPGLATGGYVKANQPQLVVIGDNKRHGEIVAPEDKLLNLLKLAVASSKGTSKDELYEAFVRAINATGLADKIEIQGNEDGLFNVVRKKAQNYKTATGKLAFS